MLCQSCQSRSSQACWVLHCCAQVKDVREITDADVSYIVSLVEQAHRQGRAIRFWVSASSAEQQPAAV